MPKALALVSGGPDSAVLLHHLSRRYSRVFPVYVRAGLHWEDVELKHLHRFLRLARLPRTAALRVMQLPSRDTYGAHWSVTGRHVPGKGSRNSAVYLPGRNLLLVAKAAVLAPDLKADAIAIGTLKGNPFGDARRCFRYAMSRAVSFAMERPIRVVAPFARLTKADLIRRGRGLPLHLTFSCLAPRGSLHCGSCNKCVERRAAFRSAGIPDKTRYGR